MVDKINALGKPDQAAADGERPHLAGARGRERGGGRCSPSCSSPSCVQIGAPIPASNAPLGWTVELCLTLWLWLVFWGSAFCLRDRDHVTFDILYLAVTARLRGCSPWSRAVAIVVGPARRAAGRPGATSPSTRSRRARRCGSASTTCSSIYLVFAVAVVDPLRSSALLREVRLSEGAEVDRPPEPTPGRRTE